MIDLFDDKFVLEALKDREVICKMKTKKGKKKSIKGKN